jgi:hypothetical protein
VAESACLALMALVDRHLATMFLAYQKTRGTSEGPWSCCLCVCVSVCV